MADFHTAPDCVRVVQSGTYGSGVWANVYYLRYASGIPDSPTLNSLCVSLSNLWNTHFAPLAHSSVSLKEIFCLDIASDIGYAGDATTTHAGTRAGTALPASVACNVSLKINVHYRGGHPRQYLPIGVAADTLNNVRFTDAFLQLATTNYDNWKTAVNSLTNGSTSWSLVAVRWRVKGVDINPGIPYPIVAHVIHPRIDTQRRRLGKETA